MRSSLNIFNDRCGTAIVAMGSNEVRITLARQQDCEVSLCEHGTFHVTVGHITAHLDRPAFERLCSAMAGAWERLASQQDAGCRGPSA